jgi:glutamine phosphoribosylpyrophosphate amidotransferase
MCGIIGVALDNPTYEELFTVQRVFQESRIRGMHATGISWVKDGLVHTIKDAIPADQFVDKYMKDMGEFLDNGKLMMVGHCRYSTSDLEYNQPIASECVSVVHNGVITQELPENWEELYGYKCSTKNDTELLLHTINERKSPLEVWHDSSLAVIELYGNQKMRFYRNGKRPMYLTNMPSGSIITSTKDIPMRAGIREISEPVTMNTYCVFDEHLTLLLERVKIDGEVDYQPNAVY